MCECMKTSCKCMWSALKSLFGCIWNSLKSIYEAVIVVKDSVLPLITCGDEENGEPINKGLKQSVKSLITLIPILDLISDYWLVISDRSWESENDLVLGAFYVFVFSQILMIWGSNIWWTAVLLKDEHVREDCGMRLITPLLILIPWAWVFFYLYPIIRYPVLMPLMVFAAIGWWEEVDECIPFLWKFLYPNDYYRTFVLDTESALWKDKETTAFTAVVRYFTTFAAGTRGLIDMASDKKVAKKLKDEKVPEVYTRILSLCALVEELAENGGGMVISVVQLMGETPTTAAYVSFTITVLSFLIETGRMLGKIYLQYGKKPCHRLGVIVVLLYRRGKCMFFCCGRYYKNKENEEKDAYPECCICPIAVGDREKFEINEEITWETCCLFQLSRYCRRNKIEPENEDEKEAGPESL